MSKFTDELALTEMKTDWRLWRIDQDFIYEVGSLGSGRFVVVPNGFQTDGASVPRFLWAFLPPWGTYSRAAVIHDYLGTLLTAGHPHPEGKHQVIIDSVFLDAMRICGTSWIVRHLMWAAVRLAAIVGRRDI